MPQHRGLITPADQEKIRAALAKSAAADEEVRDTILTAVENGASVRELAAFTGLSTNTISRWKRTY